MNRVAWNRLASDYSASVCDIVATDRAGAVDALVQLALQRRAFPTTIDLGCGIGTFVKRYATRLGPTIGVDYASKMLTVAKRRCGKLENVSWICASIEHTAALLGHRADFVVCLNVLTCRVQSHRESQWQNLADITKRAGCALIVLPSIESARFVETHHRGNGSKVFIGRTGLVRNEGDEQMYYSRQGVCAALDRFGFRCLRVTRVSYPWIEEGLRHSANKNGALPWDWACLAVKR